MKELEQLIRRIVRDELKSAIKELSSKPLARTPKANPSDLVMTVLEASDRPMSTGEIRDVCFDSSGYIDKGYLSTAIRNAVFSLHKKGKLKRYMTSPEWTYSIKANQAPINP